MSRAGSHAGSHAGSDAAGALPTREEAVAADRPVDTPRLEVDGVSKTFGRQCALRDVRLRIMPGELHGLVGQNGSGKSTLAKILTGYHAPDPGGAVRIDSQRLRLPVRPREARELGLGVVHQTLGLIDDETVLANIRVGRFRPSRWVRRIRWDTERRAAREVLDRLGRSVPLDAPVATLSAQDRATVAIARAFQQNSDRAGLVIFDESTRALGRDTLRHFYELLDGMLAGGTAVLLISHRLDEVMQVTDAVTVLRDGEVVEAGVRTADIASTDLVRAMLGKTLAGLPAAPARSAGAADRAVRMSGVTGDVLRGFDLAIGGGEIVGVTGLAGSGYEELPYLLAGARPAAAGTLRLGERTLELTRCGCEAALAAGVALVPAKRDVEGLATAMSVSDNITLPQARARGSALRVNRRWETDSVASLLERLDVRPPLPKMPVDALSGGNQQKVLLAKWLATRPRLLVLHEPTQAVDVGARRDIIATLRAAAEDGCAVLVAGSDDEELAALCDRVLVIHDAGIGKELAAPLTADAIAVATYGHSDRSLRRMRR